MQCRSQNQMVVRQRQVLSISPCRVFQWCPPSHTQIYPAKDTLTAVVLRSTGSCSFMGECSCAGAFRAVSCTWSDCIIPAGTKFRFSLYNTLNEVSLEERTACLPAGTQDREGSRFIIPYSSCLAAFLIAGRDFDFRTWNEKLKEFPTIKVCRAIDLKSSWAIWYTDSLNYGIINAYYEGCIASSFPAASLSPFENVLNPLFVANMRWDPLKLNFSDVRSLIL